MSMPFTTAASFLVSRMSIPISRRLLDLPHQGELARKDCPLPSGGATFRPGHLGEGRLHIALDGASEAGSVSSWVITTAAPMVMRYVANDEATS